MGNFEIRIGPLDSAGFQSFYPGAENYERTRFLTDLYILDRLEYDLAIILAEGEARTVSLGDPERARLGLNTWVFSSPRIGEVRKCYSPRRTGG
jgi:predicted component of type VI protein secretion system